MRRVMMMFWLLASLSGCAWLGKQPDGRELVSMEYFLRWQRGEFQTASRWQPFAFLIPPAFAELPPQYQRAFSLYIEFQHDRQELHLEWHSQMVMEPDSHKSSHQTLGEPPYTRLVETLEKKIACTASTEPGWTGPSPAYISIRKKEDNQLLFASTSPKGPSGPGRDLGQKNLRRYLCSKELEEQLDFFRKELNAVNE